MPRHLQDWAKAVDEGICKEADCPECERHGLEYRPYQNGRAYRVLGICSACDATMEF